MTRGNVAWSWARQDTEIGIFQFSPLVAILDWAQQKEKTFVHRCRTPARLVGWGLKEGHTGSEELNLNRAGSTHR